MVTEDQTSQFVAPIMHAPDHAKHWKYIPPRTQGSMGRSEDRVVPHHDTSDDWLLHDQKIAIFTPLPLTKLNLSKCTTETLKAILQDILDTIGSLISPCLFNQLTNTALAVAIFNQKPPHYDLQLVKVRHSVFDKAFLHHPGRHPMWYHMQCSRSGITTSNVTPTVPNTAPLDPNPNTTMVLQRHPDHGLTVQWIATHDIQTGDELFFDYGIRPSPLQQWEDQVPEPEQKRSRSE